MNNNNLSLEPAWYDSVFMKTCRLESAPYTPVWMMRQAGRYMQEYQAVRSNVGFLELCHNPQLCSEVMCTAVERLGVDAAILFSDLLVVLPPMGLDVEFLAGDGPKINKPLRLGDAIDKRLIEIESIEPLQYVMEAVRQTRQDLPAELPLIGFAGAPFTLASYAIEGGSSRNYIHSKAIMYGDEPAWQEIMQRFARSIARYLTAQAEAGAQCLQVFDSWAGALSVADYRRYVLPAMKTLFAGLPQDVPVINFATGNPQLLPLLAEVGPNIVGVDWRCELDQAWKLVGDDKGVQGNLDSTVLLTNRDVIYREVERILKLAAGKPGHIFNLGHGILPQTPVENAIALVEAVHQLSRR